MKKNHLFSGLFLAVILSAFTSAQALPSITDKTKGMKSYKGFINFFWDEKDGKIWLEIKHFDTEFLYVDFLSHGLGSNDIGLDRGQIGPTRIVKFHRIGPKVLMIQPNLDYRAGTSDTDEKKAVNESFAESVIWGFKVEAEEKGKVLVDATDFFLNDNHNVAGRIRNAKQGNYSVDMSRSAINPDRTRNFPKNTEVDVILTFKGAAQGNWVRSVTPTPNLITIREHHSFVALPDPGYRPRVFDPRSGYIDISYMDFATPLGQSLVKRYIIRHRLQKKDPNAELSEAVKPIVYYVDRSAPEPIRSALVKGASWWNEAFTAAGFKNAFQVKVLPKDADPLDIRYNVIMWVHRSTRGWSYGGSVVDPRTGEIIKGHVSLGSQRVRQDYLIAEGLLNPYRTGQPVSDKMKKMALARIRQLAAHETGHTLGFVHNYIASTQGRASVMDYPAPLIKLDKNGNIDLSDAYATGIGEWDKVAINYGYHEFPPGTDEKTALNKIISSYLKKGQKFLSDQDARPVGSANPSAHLWDNGVNAVDELIRMMKIRKKVLDNFSEKAIQPGVPMATIEDVLVPAYMMHRYQVIAASKTLGGLEYTYAMRGDGQMTTRIVSGDEQRRALEALLSTLQPENLVISEKLIESIPPRPLGYQPTRELFPRYTGAEFDPVAAAEGAAEITLSQIFNSQRAARLLEYNARNDQNPGLAEVIDKTLAVTWEKAPVTGLKEEISLIVDRLVLNNMLSLAADENANGQVRAVTLLKIYELKKWISNQLINITDENRKALYISSLSIISGFISDPAKYQPQHMVSPPPGDPIGGF